MKKLIPMIGLLIAFSSSVYADISVESLEKESPSELKPYGELAEMFKIGSDNTDIQRDKKLKEIIGKVVQWKLPVYEVRESKGGYKIQTSAKKIDFKTRMNIEMMGLSSLIKPDPVSTFIQIYARNEQEKQLIESLKTGDDISFKGVIKDVSMRALEIEPAILILDAATTETPTQPEPKQEVAAEQPKQETQQAEPNSEPVSAISSPYKILWIGNWGSEIFAHVSNQPCQKKDLVNNGYTYSMAVTIPVARLKNKNDAWDIQGDMAISVQGCWFKKGDNLIHAKIIRKKDGKVTEQDFNMTEKIWIAQ